MPQESTFRGVTTRQAAALANLTTDQLRARVSAARHRHGIELHLPRDQWPDRRTPIYDEQRLREYLALGR